MKKMTLYAMALCALSVSACADRMSKSSTDNTSGITSNANTPSTTSSNYSPSSMTGPSTSTSTAQTSYGVVQAIDQMQRQDVGVGVMGAAVAGGMPTDKVYRVTVRLDDGSMQTVVMDSSPSYKIGDRVRYSNGMVQAY